MFQPNHRSQHRTARKESQDTGQPGKGAKTGQIGQDNQGMALRTGQPGKENQDRTARNGTSRTGQPGYDSQEREPRQDSQDRTARIGLPRHDRTVKKKLKILIKGFTGSFLYIKMSLFLSMWLKQFFENISFGPDGTLSGSSSCRYLSICVIFLLHKDFAGRLPLRDSSHVVSLLNSKELRPPLIHI
jgi:hypothetical protein